jgi:serine/threonine protein kinase
LAEEGVVTIADFGLGIQGDSEITENCGTILYNAPEQIAKKSYNNVNNPKLSL